MLSPTTRSMRVTLFKVMCIDEQTKTVVYKDLHVLEFVTEPATLMKIVVKKGLVAPLVPKRIVDIQCVIQKVEMSAKQFYENGKIKKVRVIQDERFKD